MRFTHQEYWQAIMRSQSGMDGATLDRPLGPDNPSTCSRVEASPRILTARDLHPRSNVPSNKRPGAGYRWVVSEVKCLILRWWALGAVGVSRFPSWTSPVRV